jgi:hypothetical protein
MAQLGILFVGLAILAWGAPPAGAAQPPRKVCYTVQLVRATDVGSVPSAGARALTVKEAKPLRPLFKWKHYWEVSRRDLVVEEGKIGTIQLNPQRAVKIDLSQAGKRVVTAMEGGRQVSTVIRPSGEAVTIMGGSRDTQSSWFVLVTRAEENK